MYVYRPKGRPAYIHFPNWATDYEIHGYSCPVRPSVTRLQVTPPLFISTSCHQKHQHAYLADTEDVAIATKYQNFREHSPALEAKNSSVTL